MFEPRNVFDNEEEFQRLRDAINAAVDDFSKSRGGNVTYGEVMFVLESIIGELSAACDGQKAESTPQSIDEMTRVTQIRGVLSRMLSLLKEKGIISDEEEVFLASSE